MQMVLHFKSNYFSIFFLISFFFSFLCQFSLLVEDWILDTNLSYANFLNKNLYKFNKLHFNKIFPQISLWDCWKTSHLYKREIFQHNSDRLQKCLLRHNYKTTVNMKEQ